jgi:hypothetical protein
MSAHDFLHTSVHELETEIVPDDTITDDSPVDEVDPEPPNTILYNAAMGSPPTPLPPGDICQVQTINPTCSC